MSPKFDVKLEFHKKKGVVEPQAATLNRAKDQILDGTDIGYIDFLSLGRTVAFCVECESYDEALEQVRKMIPLDVISNPIMERLVSMEVSELRAFE
jgi:phosphoribosylformylglycinamidine (FGAM) synthase PurS component